MLNYHFTEKLITTKRLLKELSISIGTLDYWKTEWRKKYWKKSKSQMSYQDWIKSNDDPCYAMGLRIIGKSALWDPIIFLNWLSQYQLKNKPKNEENKDLFLFIQRNASEEVKN